MHIAHNASEQQRGRASVAREKAVVVSVELPGRPRAGADPCEEIRGLASTAGAAVVGELTQRREEPRPATYLGSGKVAELAELVRSAGADVVLFDNDLSPAQGRNLEQALGVRVLDRTELILDVFATRARSAEARLQV